MTAAPAAAPAPSPRTAILLLACAAFFSGAALRVCDPLLPRLGRDFGISAGKASQVVISFALAYGLMQLVFGPLGDRFGKARLVCLALFGCAAAALACAFAPGFESLVALRVLWGMAAAGVIPLSMAWIGDTVAYEDRQATLARLLVGTLSGMMAGQLAGGLFADAVPGWRGAFATLAVGYGLIAVALLANLGKAPRAAAAAAGPAAMPSQLLSVLRTPWARVVLATVAANSLFSLGPLTFLPAHLHQRYGLSLAAASALVALYAVGGLVYAMLARRLVARLGERRMVLAGGGLMGAGFLAWWASPAAWLAGPVAFGVGFGAYLFHNTLQTHATQMAPQSRGTAVSLFAFCLFGGQAAGVSLAGLVFDRFGGGALLLAPALALPVLGVGFARALQRRMPPPTGR